MRIHSLVIALLGLYAVSQTAHSQGADAFQPGIASERSCKDVEDPPASAMFPELVRSAKEVRRATCVKGGSRDEAARAIVEFLNKEKDGSWFMPFGGFSDGNPLMQALVEIDLEKQAIPTISFALSSRENPDLPILQVNSYKRFSPIDLPRCEAEAAKYKKNEDGGGKTCREALEEFRQIYGYVVETYAEPGRTAFGKYAKDLSADWDRFLFETRSQTLLELAINSALYSKTEGKKLSEPPPRQWIVLHPDLVVENVGDAVDGEKTKEALMVEIAGLNYWKQERWYLPSGGALIALYSDRSGVSDVGYGLAVHFKSVYTIGYAKHDKRDGFFISVDLLKIFEDKKKIFDAFML